MKRLSFALVLVALVLAVIEAGAYGIQGYLRAHVPYLLWRPWPEAQRVILFAEYQRARHPSLGWPSPKALARAPYDAAGARYSPAFPKPGHACVALYGDSFTFGDNVGDAEAWGNVLAQRLGCRVDNFGIGGYGTDQALLRFRETAAAAPVAVLGIFPIDVMRNLNQHQFMLDGVNVLGFKPRFVLEDGALKLVPLPRPDDEAAFAEFLTHPGRHLPQEYYLPGTAEGPVAVEFPYTLAMLRLLAHPRLRDGLARRPIWAPSFAPDHPALALETEIVKAFVAEAKARGQRPLVVMLPSPQSIRWLKAEGAPEYQPLLDRLKASGIEIRDLAPPLLAWLNGRDPCVVVVDSATCHGHYGALGSAAVADIVAGWIGSPSE